MSTPAQIAANQENAKLSSGPTSEAGKAISSQNNLRHGLTGPFAVLPWENQEQFQTLQDDLLAEHQPVTPTERILVQEMAQSHWLGQRAILLQNECLNDFDPSTQDSKQLALYLRYQTTHNRAFYKALNQLLSLREKKRKEEIGFVSQKAKEAQLKLAEQRREAAEHRAQELHQARVGLPEAQTQRHRTETVIAQVLKMPKTAQPNAA